ncbi:MAG: hypothetical protein ACO2Y2_07485 [Poseidonia sp.]
MWPVDEKGEGIHELVGTFRTRAVGEQHALSMVESTPTKSGEGRAHDVLQIVVVQEGW